MSLKERLGKLVQREKVETHPVDFTPDEQMILEIITRSRSANIPEIFAVMLEIRREWGGAETILHSSEIVNIVRDLEDSGFVQVDDEHQFEEDLGHFWRFTKSGSAAIRQIRRAEGRFSAPVTVNIPIAA